MNNTETANVVAAIIFVVAYIAIAVLPRAIRYFADRERNPTDDDLAHSDASHKVSSGASESHLARAQSESDPALNSFHFRKSRVSVGLVKFQQRYQTRHGHFAYPL